MSTPDSGIVQVAEGCGPRFHRTPFGRCVPNYYRGPVRRFCPPGTHLGRFGACRRNF
ncbi:GCG_CRPN prefix-to-repeats domain-containing protein [Acidisphaera sp. L21]|uniref:GCG_CRPN prefix-to-repeats domain-containing protein n=1 Tax=Acidisphaera sp. L21 TaxID=1641851 RepID=UPI0038CF8630